ncbi:MAG TPA: hypothetical protein VGI19_12590 [Candidatus Cybelea sp.]
MKKRAFCVAVALLAGCAAPPFALRQAQGDVAQGRLAQDRLAQVDGSQQISTSGDRLWTNGACQFRPFSGLCIFSYPRGRYITWLEFYGGGGPAYDLCADKHGHVFVLEGGADSGGFGILVYGTDGRGFRVLNDQENRWAGGCAADAKTGDLAVANVAQSGQRGNLVIFSQARGLPKPYTISNLFSYDYCAYDASGDLFVDGTDKDGTFVLDERVAGERNFTAVTLDRRVRVAGPVQWDGRNLALGYADDQGASIYRVNVRGSEGRVIATTRLLGPGSTHVSVGPFWIQGDRIVASYFKDAHSYPIGVWKYPDGGQLMRTIHRGGNAHGQRTVTVGVGQSR